MSQYSRHLCGFVVLVGAVLLLLSACAGSGEGLDEEGNPLGAEGPGAEDGLPDGDDSVPADSPTFSSIQATILEPICVCHQGANAPLGLVLNTDATWDMLVATPSVEVPDLFRVEPGSPDDSYLIRKLEGGPDIVGERMPRGGPPLVQEEIDLIRQWILDGALDN